MINKTKYLIAVKHYGIYEFKSVNSRYKFICSLPDDTEYSISTITF